MIKLKQRSVHQLIMLTGTNSGTQFFEITTRARSFTGPPTDLVGCVGEGCALPPQFSFSYSFRQKLCQIIGQCPPFGVGAPQEILNPLLGSASSSIKDHYVFYGTIHNQFHPLSLYFHRPPTKLRKCNVFGCICLSFRSHGGGGPCTGPRPAPPLYMVLALVSLLFRSPSPLSVMRIVSMTLAPPPQTFKLAQLGLNCAGIPPQRHDHLCSLKCPLVLNKTFNLPAVVDFPTPPFPEATTITWFTPPIGNFLGRPLDRRFSTASSFCNTSSY